MFSMSAPEKLRATEAISSSFYSEMECLTVFNFNFRIPFLSSYVGSLVCTLKLNLPERKRLGSIR